MVSRNRKGREWESKKNPGQCWSSGDGVAPVSVSKFWQMQAGYGWCNSSSKPRKVQKNLVLLSKSVSLRLFVIFVTVPNPGNHRLISGMMQCVIAVADKVFDAFLNMMADKVSITRAPACACWRHTKALQYLSSHSRLRPRRMKKSLSGTPSFCWWTSTTSTRG